MYCLLTRHFPVCLSKQILMKALIKYEKKNLEIFVKTLDKKFRNFYKKLKLDLLSMLIKVIHLSYKLKKQW